MGAARWRSSPELAEFSTRPRNAGQSVCFLRLDFRVFFGGESNVRPLWTTVSRTAKRCVGGEFVYLRRTVGKHGSRGYKTYLRHVSARKRSCAGRSVEHGVVDRVALAFSGSSPDRHRDWFAQSTQRYRRASQSAAARGDQRFIARVGGETSEERFYSAGPRLAYHVAKDLRRLDEGWISDQP